MGVNAVVVINCWDFWLLFLVSASQDSPACAGVCAGSTEMSPQHHPGGWASLEAQRCSVYGLAFGSVPVFTPTLLWAKPCKLLLGCFWLRRVVA